MFEEVKSIVWQQDWALKDTLFLISHFKAYELFKVKK